VIVAARAVGVDFINLLRLTGSVRQVAWTTRIRFDFTRHLGDVRLRQVTTAKFWIDNREAI
jgi:hypothetical protein